MIRSTTSPWTGMVPVDDTALSVTDTRGPGHPVVVELAERSAEVISWESDDPRVAELATDMAEHYLANPAQLRIVTGLQPTPKPRSGTG